jgi:prepilin-type N-terminal cleavage/methylation domain-containing protein
MTNQSIGSYKRGFTIVELAIVLVVIGVILSMLVKARHMVHVARMKAEVYKIAKFEAAFNIYYARTGSVGAPLPARQPGGAQFDLRPLLVLGVFNEKDLDYGLLSDDTKWDFASCLKIADATVWGEHGPGGIRPGTSMCLQPTNGGGYVGSGVTVQPRAFHMEFICHIENMLDDTNLLTGRGTIHLNVAFHHGESVTRDFAPEQYEDCYSLWPRVGGNYFYGMNSISYTPL